MNSVVRTCLAPETNVDECIDTVLSQAKRRSVPMGWFLLPGTEPADISSKLEARLLVYRIGALTASPLGYPVYLRLGFQEFCRIPGYVWLPEQ